MEYKKLLAPFELLELAYSLAVMEMKIHSTGHLAMTLYFLHLYYFASFTAGTGVPGNPFLSLKLAL